MNDDKIGVSEREVITPGQKLRNHLYDVHRNEMAHSLSDVDAHMHHEHAHTTGGLAGTNHDQPAELHAFDVTAVLPKHRDPDATTEMPIRDAIALALHVEEGHGRRLNDHPDPVRAHHELHMMAIGSDHFKPAGLHPFLPAVAAGVQPRATSDAGDSLPEGWQHDALVATVEQMGNEFERRMGNLDVGVADAFKRLRAVEGSIGNVRARLAEIDSRRRPAATVDARALAQAQTLLAEALVGLGAIDSVHFNHSRWPSQGSERSVAVLRNLHRLMSILDGVADARQPMVTREMLGPCNCDAGVNAFEGRMLAHRPGCPQYLAARHG